MPDYDEGIAFFVGRVGLRLLTDEDQGGAKRWVTVGGEGAAILLAQAEGDAQRARIGQQAGGRVGFFLRSDDFASDHARMLAAGVAFEEAPRREPYGAVAIWRDPWGNRWDLLGPPDPLA